MRAATALPHLLQCNIFQVMGSCIGWNGGDAAQCTTLASGMYLMPACLHVRMAATSTSMRYELKYAASLLADIFADAWPVIMAHGPSSSAPAFVVDVMSIVVSAVV